MTQTDFCLTAECSGFVKYTHPKHIKLWKMEKLWNHQQEIKSQLMLYCSFSGLNSFIPQ